MNRPRLVLTLCTLCVLLLAGCSVFKFSQPPSRQIGEPSNDEQQRQADRKALQTGQKPQPVSHTRE